MPLALVNVSILVDHTTFALRHAVDPVSVITIAVFEEECASAMLFVLEPITGVLATQLASFISPVCALAMLFIHGPHTFVFVTFGVELDAETFLAIVAPVTNVSGRAFPHLALNGAILLLWLLFDPIDRPVWTVLLGLGIGHLPVVNEWWPLLDDY